MIERETIFLVDDDSGLREALAQRLRLAGYRVQSFASPRGFLESAPLCSPGCAILDLRMPELSGLDVQRAMVANGATLPVIFLSGYGDLSVTREARRLGAVDFLEKPVSGSRLLATIELALERDRATRVALESVAEKTRSINP